MSGLEDLYREIILDHYRNPRNRGELDVPPAVRSEGFNPLCGDEIIVYLETEDDVVSAIRIGGTGCSISQSSASMMSEAATGRTLPELRELIRSFQAMMSVHESSLDADGAAGSDEPPAPVDLGDLDALRGVVKFPVRIKCATLGWHTLIDALDKIST